MIDSAPTIPKERDIFPDITVVITKPIRGKMQKVVILEKDFAQFWPDKISEKLINPPIIIEIKHLNINAFVIPSKIKSIKL